MTEPTKLETIVTLLDTWLQKSVKRFWKWLWASFNSSNWPYINTSKWKRLGLTTGIILIIFQIPGLIKELAAAFGSTWGAGIAGLIIMPLIAGIFLWLCYWAGRAIYLITEKVKELYKWLDDEWTKAKNKVSKK